jgi:hypothetical protein
MSLHPRIQEIESDLRAALPEWRSDYRQIYSMLRVRPTTLLDTAWRLWDRMAASGIKYRREKDDITRGLRELIRRPLGILRKGGDCDDWNLVMLGGLLNYEFGPEGINSLYLPNGFSPRHVALLLKDNNVNMVFDVVPPASRGAWRGDGLVIPWAS